MEEAPENGKELSHSVNANRMNKSHIKFYENLFIVSEVVISG
jgi:hypothetical protein